VVPACRDEAKNHGLHVPRTPYTTKTIGAKLLSSCSLEDVANAMKDEKYGVRLADRRWHFKVHEDAFM
jgi:hypothetical protein